MDLQVEQFLQLLWQLIQQYALLPVGEGAEALGLFLFLVQWSAIIFTGIERLATRYNLTGGPVGRGYAVEDMRKIIGGNWLRIIKEVFG